MVFYSVLNEEYMITIQSYINSYFAILRGLLSCCVLFYTERNSELFSLPRQGSEWNSESMLLQYFCSTERNSELYSLPRKGSERNSESFLFRGTARIPSEITICSVYSVFRGIILLSEIPNPTGTYLRTLAIYLGHKMLA
jgi:hypothetical protein